MYACMVWARIGFVRHPEAMPEIRFLSTIALVCHPCYWPKNGVFSVSDSMNVVSDSYLHKETYVRSQLSSRCPMSA